MKEQSGHYGNLPDRIDLVGCNETCERIITALSSNKAVEIVAPPGYGKTSVVIEALHFLKTLDKVQIFNLSSHLEKPMISMCLFLLN